MLDVSLDTRDRGRGINSTVSENPTRALLDDRIGGESERPLVSPFSVEGVAGSTFDWTAMSKLGKLIGEFSSPDGLVGALPPIGTLFDDAGLMIIEMS